VYGEILCPLYKITTTCPTQRNMTADDSMCNLTP
jgi:hypothetical protein